MAFPKCQTVIILKSKYEFPKDASIVIHIPCKQSGVRWADIRGQQVTGNPGQVGCQ